MEMFLRLTEYEYTREEIDVIQQALRQNASQWPAGSPQYASYMNVQLQALIDRYEAITVRQQKTLRSLGYADEYIRLVLSANQISLDQLILNTQQTQRQMELLEKNGCYTPMEVCKMLMAGFTVQNMQTLVDRVMQAKKNVTDQCGLTVEQIHDLLFGGRDTYGQLTSGIVTSLRVLSDLVKI